MSKYPTTSATKVKITVTKVIGDTRSIKQISDLNHRYMEFQVQEYNCRTIEIKISNLDKITGTDSIKIARTIDVTIREMGAGTYMVDVTYMQPNGIKYQFTSNQYKLRAI